ncbi:helix-turn-helix domain-containing protein [soil metagenome]
MTTYGQFCPVAKAMELLDERWTLLVVRELLCGSRHFNELRRGVPRMSPALLSKRLRTLCQAGVLERHEDGNRITYRLMPAGEELRPVVEALGTWGTRWVPHLGDEHLDPHLLLWDIHRNLDLEAMPPTRTVLAFCLHDARPGARDWWVVAEPGEVDLCDADPGHPVAARIEGSLEALTRVWVGELSWGVALRSGSLALHAPSAVRRQVPTWLKLSAFATVPRPAATTRQRVDRRPMAPG